jgi:hypothetical protein
MPDENILTLRQADQARTDFRPDRNQSRIYRRTTLTQKKT